MCPLCALLKSTLVVAVVGKATRCICDKLQCTARQSDYGDVPALRAAEVHPCGGICRQDDEVRKSGLGHLLGLLLAGGHLWLRTGVCALENYKQSITGVCGASAVPFRLRGVTRN